MDNWNYSKGISWINDVRIPFVDGDKTVNHNTVPGSFVGSVGYSEKIYTENTQGRFPANLLVSDDMLNDIDRGFDNKGTNSRYYDIDIWFEKLLENIS